MNGLSAAQASIWASHQLSNDKSLYNTSECLFFSERLDHSRLSTAIQRTVRECENLNSHYRAQADGTGKRVPAAVNASIIFEQLAPKNPTEELVDHWAKNFDSPAPFDLEQGLPCRFVLFSGAEQDALLISVHHIALDGFGYQLFLERLAANYTDQSEPKEPTPPMTLVVAEDREFAASPAYENARAFWREKLAPIDEAPRFGRTAVIERGYLKITANMPSDMWKELTAVAGQSRVTRINWTDLLTAAFAVALREATGTDHASIGLPAMNRMGSASAKIPCMQMNIVPLVFPLADNDSLLSVATKVALEKKLIRKHASYRHESIARDRLASGNSPQIFGPVINIMPFTRSARFGALEAKRYVVNSGPAADVTLAVFCESPQNPPELEFCAHPDVLSKEALQAKAQQFLQLSTELIASPNSAIANITAMRRERTLRREIIQGNALKQPATSVLMRIKEQAHTRPQHPAIEHQGRLLTYSQLAATIQTWAIALQELGVRTNTPVGVLLPRSIEAVIAALAIMEAGGTYVPFDPEQPDARQQHLWLTSEARILIAERMPVQNTFGECTVITPVLLNKPAKKSLRVQHGDAAYIMFTSGSTGAPKGIVIPHEALNHFTVAVNERYRISENDRVLQFAPLHFDASIEEIFVSLTNGATLIIRTPEMLDSFAAFSRAIDSMNISVLDLPTAWWNEWCEALASGQSTIPKTLHTVILGGEAVTVRALTQWQSAATLSVRLINSYGPTETTVVALTSELTDWRPGDEITIGTPIAGVSCAVIGPGGHPDTEGELVIIGPTVGSHYIGSQLTLRTSVVPGSEPNAYRTGDRVRRIGPSLAFIGRFDHEVKLSGHRIQPAEIEKAALALPNIKAAAIEVVHNERGRVELAAFVVSSSHSVQSLRAALKAMLPAPMVPKHIRIVPSLPKNLAGKIDHVALRSMFIHTGASRASIEAAHSIYKRVRAVWEDEFAPLPIADDDSFFSLGGQSLQAMQLALRLSQVLQHEVTVADVLTYPTLESFAQVMEARYLDVGAEHASSPSITCTILSDAAADTIFAFPGVGGGCAQFLALAAALKNCANIAVFEAPKPIGESDNTNVIDWAKKYAKEILAISPTGTIHLLGHSFGGWLAYETARRLEAAGCTVSLFLLDTIPPEKAPVGDVDTFIKKIGQYSLEEMTADAKTAISYQLALHKSYKPSGSIRGAVWRIAARETNTEQGNAPWFNGPVYIKEVPANHYTILTNSALACYKQTIADSLQHKDLK